MVVKIHADARAIAIQAGMLAISMDDLIELTFKHNSVVTWQ